MEKEKIVTFIDDYCRLVLKHKMQFSFCSEDLYEVSVEEYKASLEIGQTYPNAELAEFVRRLK